MQQLGSRGDDHPPLQKICRNYRKIREFVGNCLFLTKEETFNEHVRKTAEKCFVQLFSTILRSEASMGRFLETFMPELIGE